MHWDIRHARIFIAVAETLGFSAAARSLNTTQSAISRAVSQMEQDLGVALLVRTTRSVELTAEGRLLLDECRDVVAQFDRWIRRARTVADGLAGELLVGANDFALQSEMPVIIKRFREAYPQISISFRNMSRQHQYEALNKGEVDVGFVMGPMSDQRFQSLPTASFPLNVIMHHAHPFATQDEVHVDQIKGQSMILGSRREWHAFRSFLDTVFSEAKVPMTVTQEINDSVAIFGLVSADVGITIYPECTQGFQLKGVVSRRLTGTTRKVESFAIWPRAQLSQAAHLFVGVVEAYCQSKLQ